MAINAITFEKLARIQGKLNAPKNQRNTFGKYNYRSAEDILEAVKPLLREESAAIVIDDEIVQIGERYYVKATATFLDKNGEISSRAYAREENEKKGMDASQLTGATSSYARKYALNGLFAIDDCKDADTRDNREEPKKADVQTRAKFTAEQAQAAKAAADRLHPLAFDATLKEFGVKTLLDLEYDRKSAFWAAVVENAKELNALDSGAGKGDAK